MENELKNAPLAIKQRALIKEMAQLLLRKGCSCYEMATEIMHILAKSGFDADFEEIQFLVNSEMMTFSMAKKQ